MKTKTITVNQLHRLLGKIIEQGNGRAPVCVNKLSFAHPLEDDGAVIIDVKSVRIQLIPLIDGDGFTEINKDGSERMRLMAVISGDAND